VKNDFCFSAWPSIGVQYCHLVCLELEHATNCKLDFSFCVPFDVVGEGTGHVLCWCFAMSDY
jgi:hypothetical protein